MTESIVTDFMYANDDEVIWFIQAYKRYVREDLGFEPTDRQAIVGLITLGAGQVPQKHFEEAPG